MTFGPSLENHPGREISSGVFAGKPIGGKRDLLIKGLFETELTACAIRRSHDVTRKVVSTERNSRSALEGLTHLGIDVIAGVVRTITNWNEEVIAYAKAQPLSLP